MNKYLTKIAKEDRGNGAGWVIPAAMTAVPVVAMGISRHGEHDLKMKHGPVNPKLESALMKRNIKTTAALTGATIAAAGIGEYARRSFATKQKDDQTKDIKKVVNQAVSKAVEKQAAEKEHDWRPAIVGAAAEVPIAMGVGYLGKLTARKLLGGKYENTAMGVIGGLTAAGEADFLQRRAEGHHEKKVSDIHNKYLNKAAGLGKHNKVPDSKFPKKQLEIGRKVELEHTNDRQAAENIAKDHLSESSKYYTDLAKMEAKEKKEKKKN